jgi:predicted amidophosphoribosyltransferase
VPTRGQGAGSVGGAGEHGGVGVSGLFGALVDLVLPSDCAGCGGPVAPWCAGCLEGLGPPCWPYMRGGPHVHAVGRYSGPLRNALLRYKERGRRDLAAPLADLLSGRLDELVTPHAPIWLVPAPSRRAAARARGGDHVLRLCRRLATLRDDVGVANALSLAKGARDSVGLDAAQRAANLAGRIRITERGLPPRGAHVVLLDDVVTTGATLRACRNALALEGVIADHALVLCAARARADDHEVAVEFYRRAGDL